MHVIFTGKSELKVQKVAFFVGLQDNINQFDEDVDAKDVVFEKVVTNVGEAYTSDTGRFTAPCNGTYSFTVVVAAQGKHKVRIHSTPDALLSRASGLFLYTRTVHYTLDTGHFTVPGNGNWLQRLL